MAIEITEVTQQRAFEYTSENTEGRAQYFVYFKTDTTEEYADYVKKASMCLTAINPPDIGVSENISNRIPRAGEQLVNIDETVSFDTYVRNVIPRMNSKQNNWWTVDVEYREPDTNSDDDQQDQLDDDPENIEVVYAWDAKNIKKTIWRDFTPPAAGGPLPIIASNGDPFTKLPQVDRAILTCTITRKTQGTYDPFIVAGVLNHINSVPMTINGKGPFPEKTVKLVRWSGREREAIVTKSGVPPALVTYDDESIVFEIDLEKWFGRVFDQGITFELQSAQDGLCAGRHMIRRNGEKVTKPEPLNGRGLQVYDEEGCKNNNIVPRALPDEPGGAVGEPGIEEVEPQRGAMLLFNFYEASDIKTTIGGTI